MFSRFVALVWMLCAMATATAHESALVRIGDLWRYHKGADSASQPHPNWQKPGFEDSRWRFASSGFEVPDEHEGLVGNGRPGYMFMRRTFKVADPASLRSLVLRVEHEQGYIAWLNGVEVARNQNPGIYYPTPQEQAAGMEDPLLTVDVHDLSKHISLLTAGDNVLAIEGPYTGQSLSTLSLAASITANFPRGPFVQNNTATGVQIIWRTATPASSFVRYGLSPSLSTVVTNADLVTNHVVTLTGLAPDTKYFYQAGSATNNDAEPLLADIEAFRTLKTSGPTTFAVLGDSGDATSPQRLIAGVVRGTGADLVLHTGDIVYSGFTDATVDTRVFNYYQQHMKSTPYFFTTGNHDHNCCGGIPDTNATNYQIAFYLPTNSMTGTELFYSFDHADAHFVSLYNPWFANYVFTNGSPQYIWLTNDLAATTKPWKFLFFHSPIAHSGSHAAQDRNNNGIPDQKELMELLLPVAERYGVSLIFAGHEHNFEKLAPTNGVHHVVTGGGGVTALYGLTQRNIACAQHRQTNHCLKVTLNGDVLRVQALNTLGAPIDGFVIHRGLPPDRIYSSSWNTPTFETAAPNADGNVAGQTFDLIGTPVLPRSGRFANMGEFYVNNDSTNLYLGFRNAMFYRDNNIFLFIEAPNSSGATTMAGLGNGIIDPTGQGVDGLDCLENLSFSSFSPAIACILGDEFGDRTTNSFARTNLALNIGQGVFRLDTNFSAVAQTRLQQFNRSPEGATTIPNDNNADFIEVSIPFAALAGAQPGQIIKVAAVVGGPGFDPVAQTRQLDTAVLGASFSGSGQGPFTLGAISVRLAFPPNFDNDGDGLLDNWELAYGLNPQSSAGNDGAGGDPDNDGHTNGQEQLAGTDPRNPDSVLRVSLTPVDSGFYRVSWPTVPGKSYQLEYAENRITDFAGFAGPNWPRVAISGNEIYEDDISTNVPPSVFRTYRVRVLEP
jgi:hypothetical protein